MNIGSWIPQFFYDLISRIAPGSILIIISMYAFNLLSVDATNGNLLFLNLPIFSNSIFFVFGIAASYVLGMLLNGIGYFFKEKLWKSEDTLKEEKELENFLIDQEKSKSFRYDSIHLYIPRIGARIAKLSAERGFCRVLFIGSILLTS